MDRVSFRINITICIRIEGVRVMRRETDGSDMIVTGATPRDATRRGATVFTAPALHAPFNVSPL